MEMNYVFFSLSDFLDSFGKYRTDRAFGSFELSLEKDHQGRMTMETVDFMIELKQGHMIS
jgi:hypothetical protein